MFPSPSLFIFSLSTAAALVAADSSAFQADSSIDADRLHGYVKAAAYGREDVLATYPTCNDCDSASDVDISGKLKKIPGFEDVLMFMADMDVDCDGVAWQCPGNMDGQPETSFGHMNASQAPWYVIPEDFISKGDVQANALGAVICNDKMFYGIFADSNGDSPQVIGEASLVLAQACFPDDGMSGANGHPIPDVAYIVFPHDAPQGVGDETLDYSALKQLGDQKLKDLVNALDTYDPLQPSGGTFSDQEAPDPEQSTTTDNPLPDPTVTTMSGGNWGAVGPEMPPTQVPTEPEPTPSSTCKAHRRARRSTVK
ncbi:Chitosanase-domain-containing protein [Exidia glandulosa HHB12029]|uniref:Endo-chitosanase n=1 Tax=Exidia glandulosa HHB12029 TaxID=1314781 RepID=A0A165EHH9_EXIGL|nr:Chitosanase-domain-containing protein [Exidia glandulosa HHB12029]